jgi:hypothetical protein
MAKYHCGKCGIALNKNNWAPSRKKEKKFICKRCDNQRRKDGRVKLKSEIIAAYGGECVCCTCDIPEFLAIDHIDGTGAKHRRTLSKNKGNVPSNVFYSWLKKEGFPKDNFQLLCFNCNFAKHICGICPHQFKK